MDTLDLDTAIPSKQFLAVLVACSLLVVAGCSSTPFSRPTPAPITPPTQEQASSPPASTPTLESRTPSPTQRPTPTPGDTDDDGLSDRRERDLGTDPLDSDTDGDGLTDGREIELGTDPLASDTDVDGLSDSREMELGTEPTTEDSDDDDVSDGEELERNLDPLDPDTDGDGLRDGREIALGSDPLNADTDGDELSDGNETDLGTDPTSRDTDSDGLPDRQEVTGPTDPTRADTDSDGLSDGREVEIGTDPTSGDTDDDNLLDGWEVAGETDDGAALPEADPLRMDLYLQVNYGAGAGIDVLTTEEKRDIIEGWNEMPVENPDGSTGISVHLDDSEPHGGHLDENLEFDSADEFSEFGGVGELGSAYYTEEVLGQRKGVYHLVLIGDIEDSYGGGRAMSPGRTAVVFESDRRIQDQFWHTSYDIIHEVLHNVLGVLNEENRCDYGSQSWRRSHSCEGWLGNEDLFHLPRGIAKEIEDNGFEP